MLLEATVSVSSLLGMLRISAECLLDCSMLRVGVIPENPADSRALSECRFSLASRKRTEELPLDKLLDEVGGT